MTIACPAPDESLGVALRLSSYLDCQSRALGENGFEALVGGPIVASMLSAAITIFVALIGYRLLLGSIPTLRDGFGWAMRLGLVLALTTGWPAFQTLVYDVATKGPVEIATTLLPAIGLPASEPDARIQDAYEVIGHGISAETPTEGSPGGPTPAGVSAPVASQPTIVSFPASPIAASLLVLSSIGIVAALRLAAGFIVAIGPLAIIGLLFDNTTGLLASWIRALVGTALGVLGTTVTSMLEIVAVESEIARMRDVQAGLLPTTASDPAAFATIIAVFGLIALVIVYASFRAAGGLRLTFAAAQNRASDGGLLGASASSRSMGMRIGDEQRQGGARAVPARTRAEAVSDALASTAQRDAAMRDTVVMSTQRQGPIVGRVGTDTQRSVLSVGQGGRRTSPRRTRSATRRDGSA